MKTLRQKGYTLYELLITTLVVGVLLSIGVPSFVTFGQNSRMTASVNDLLGSFHLARSEAARSKDNVTICASASSTTANPTCDGVSFEDGWIVFQDTSGDAQRDVGEALIRSHPPLPEQITVLSPGQGNYFAYGPTGLGRGQIGALPPTTSVVFCDDRGNTEAGGNNSAARALTVLPIGRAAIVRTTGQIENEGGCP